MIKQSELDSLKNRIQEEFLHKQAAYDNYKKTKEQARKAYNEKQSAWEKRVHARQAMNQAYAEVNATSEKYGEIWNEFNRLRSEKSARIDLLRFQADAEHQQMQSYFNLANDDYRFGDKAKAPEHSAEGRKHRDKRNALNAEITKLTQEIRDAKAYALKHAPTISVKAYRDARAKFEEAKATHIAAEEEFKKYKQQRDNYKALFESYQDEYLHLRAEYQAELDEYKKEQAKP